MNTRFRSLWLLSVLLPLIAGGISAGFESAIHNGQPCSSASNTGGAAYDLIFLALALVAPAIVGVVGWRSERSAEDTVGPFCIAMCLGIFLVFIGLAPAWGGHGCMV